MHTARPWLSLTVALVFSACSFAAPTPDRTADVIVVGDSILAWHRGSGRAIPDVVEDATGLSISNVAVNGARFIGSSASIPSQYVSGDWDWVIVDGGGNDLLSACGTAHEDQILNALISPDGRTGAIPQFVTMAATQGARVVVVGYYPVSDRGGPFVECRAVLKALGDRQTLMAANAESVLFVDSGQVIGSSDLNAYAPDLVHPSLRGAALVGQLIASVIRRNSG